MDISAAALPPPPAHYTKADEAHPLFPLYRQHLAACARLLVAASDFDGWLYQREHERRTTVAKDHPDYSAFMAWMHEEQGGARPCLPSHDFPRGLIFPDNFAFWRDGGRW